MGHDERVANGVRQEPLVDFQQNQRADYWVQLLQQHDQCAELFAAWSTYEWSMVLFSVLTA